MREKTTRESIDDFSESVENLKKEIGKALKPLLDKLLDLLDKMGIIITIKKGKNEKL